MLASSLWVPGNASVGPALDEEGLKFLAVRLVKDWEELPKQMRRTPTEASLVNGDTNCITFWSAFLVVLYKMFSAMLLLQNLTAKAGRQCCSDVKSCKIILCP